MRRGVEQSIDSDVAALAGAGAARDVLAALGSDGVGGDDSEDTAVASALGTATATRPTRRSSPTPRPDSTNAASCTFAAAVVLNDRVHFANLGDSRVYLLDPDGRSCC